MSAIKKFFEKRKLNSKFKEAGSGHALNAPASRQTPPARQVSSERAQQKTTASAAQAGSAALARFEAQKSQASKKPTSSATTWKSGGGTGPGTSNEETLVPVKPRTERVDSVPIDDSILFCCPLCPATLPQNEIYQHLHQCFLQELTAEPLMMSVAMIHTLNRDKQKVEAGINILSKYLQNIIDNPHEQKYLRIRKTNKVFMEKVACLLGVEEFLASGCEFETKALPFEVAGETSDHEFFVMPEELAQNKEQLETSKLMLFEAEPLEITIDRNLKVFKASPAASRFDVPPSFYEVSTTELKQKQTEMSNQVEKSKQLRTKAMRDADSEPKRIYKYCIIRVRFPDGIIMQGTFSSYEKLSHVKNFVTEHLALDWIPFNLVDSIGRPYSDDASTLMKLKLTPGTLVNFSVEQSINEEIAASSPGGKIQYLREEFLALIQNLS